VQPAISVLGNAKTLEEQNATICGRAHPPRVARVSGVQGAAAALLDINPKLPEARMKELGIRRTVGVEVTVMFQAGS
jgi:hypothetical protein